MAPASKTFTFLSFGFAGGCLVSLIVSFASDHWVVSTQKEVAGFKNLGLWSTCFDKFRPPSWVLNKYYDGCWWVFDREMDDLRFFLIPSWFVATQVMVTTGLVFQLLAIIIMIINAINCFPYNRHKDSIALAMASTGAVLHGVTAILLTVSVILFGARADNERTWLERPDQNYLSWSFGMCVLAAFLAVLAFLTMTLESYRLWLQRKRGADPEEMFTQVPVTDFSEKRSPTLGAHYNRNQPVHHISFANQNSETGFSKQPPDRVALSAAGDSYTNQMSDFHDSRQRGRNNGYVPRQFNQQVFPEKRSVDSRSFVASTDSSHTQSMSTAASTRSGSIPSKWDDTGDYEESKKIPQPVLPEYIPKVKHGSSKKNELKNTNSESSDNDENNDSKDENNHSRTRPSRATSGGKKCAKSLTDSKKKHSKKTHSGSDNKKRSDPGHSKPRSKDKETSDDENSRSRRRSKKNSSSGRKRKSSHSRERSSSRHRSQSRESSSRHRSQSRDLSPSSSGSDSDRVSTTSRSRRKQRASKESSKKSRSRHHSAEEFLRKDKNEKSGSKKKLDRSLEDDESSSRKQSKTKGSKSKSLKGKRSKSEDLLETESLHSKRGGGRPRSSYSSYYEY